MSSLVSLLNGIVDYAGLFPPAGLEMDRVICNYSEYQKASQSWMLGRLVIPALQLSELELSAAEFFPTESPAWKISALVPNVAEADRHRQAIQSIVEFNSRHAKPDQGLAVVDAIETPISDPGTIEEVAQQVPTEISIFFEIDHRQDPAESIAAIGQLSRTCFAKIRTGGVTPELIPTTGDVARFIHRCATHGVGLKATAGLHHPIRSEFALTYDPDSPSATMHGFVNVFVAAALAFVHQLPEQEIEDVISETTADHFEFADNEIRWKQWAVDNSSIDRIRGEKAIAFGSCSFVEPIQDLQELGFGSRLAEAI